MAIGKFQIEELSDDGFEDLVWYICTKVFGKGVTKFAKGRDGGRDASFNATANEFPSKQSAWKGKTVIEAKHVNGAYRSCSEPVFFENQSSVINKQIIPKVKKLIDEDELDNYVVFTNRTLTGTYESKIRKHISNLTGLQEENVFIAGVEYIDLTLREYPQLINLASLKIRNRPYQFTYDEFSEVIETLCSEFKEFNASTTDAPISRIPMEKKNLLNDMTDEAWTEVEKDYFISFGQIRNFLAEPENDRVQEKYIDMVNQIKLSVLDGLSRGQSILHILDSIYRMAIETHPVLKDNKFLTRATIYYMYWICDIGRKSDD